MDGSLQGDPSSTGEALENTARMPEDGAMFGDVTTYERPALSKSKFIAGMQCARRLWLGSFAPELASTPDGALEDLLALGTAIGERARLVFPGGVLVDEKSHAEAVARTRALLEDPTVPAIFEAAFDYDGVRVRVDVLERLPDGTWRIREVKSGTRVKDTHLDDVAIQLYVVSGCGLRVGSAMLMHVDNTYVRGDGEIDWRLFFKERDVTITIAARLAAIPALVKDMHATLALAAAPAVEPSTHCFHPYECPFWEHCTKDKPADWVLHLPRLREKLLHALRDGGIERITDIPDDFPLRAIQVRIRDVLQTGREFVSPDLGRALEPLERPTCYLDFETMNPAIPPYAGGRPYEQIPFQWSLHRVDGFGTLSHRDFLADGTSDPRRAVAESLLAALADTDAPIVVYSPFEARVLGALAVQCPDLAGALHAVRARLHDLLPVVSAHVYHPRFDFSFSLKRVAPALVPTLGYDDLALIAEGAEASSAFTRITMGMCTPERGRCTPAGAARVLLPRHAGAGRGASRVDRAEQVKEVAMIVEQENLDRLVERAVELLREEIAELAGLLVEAAVKKDEGIGAGIWAEHCSPSCMSCVLAIAQRRRRRALELGPLARGRGGACGRAAIGYGSTPRRQRPRPRGGRAVG